MLQRVGVLGLPEVAEDAPAAAADAARLEHRGRGGGDDDELQGDLDYSSCLDSTGVNAVTLTGSQ